MKNYDIFICYRGDSPQSCELGSRIYERIKKYSIFFAPMCIGKGENFKAVIPEVMKTVSVVILLLDNNFFSNDADEDDIVDYEIRSALQNPDILFLPIMLNNFNFKNTDLSSVFSDGEIDRIKHINGLEYSGIYHFNIENELLPNLDALYDGGEQIKEMTKRDKNRYHGASDIKEVNFLKLQHDMIFDFDQSVFNQLLEGKTDISVLDVGCNNAVLTHRHFGNDKRVSFLMGIDRDKQSIDDAKQNYPQNIFEVIDIESPNFKNDFRTILKERNIEEFDIINVSMVVLHLEHPAKFFQAIRSFLKPDGVVFIRDIDDGLNIAYPDDSSIFSRLISICQYCDMLGFRQSGRQIFTYLKNANFNKVTLEKAGLNTSNMDFDQKEALFNIYFGYIPTALKKTIERTPTLRAKHDFEWVNDIIDDAYEAFMKAPFLFTLGYVIYTAKK